MRRVVIKHHRYLPALRVLDLRQKLSDVLLEVDLVRTLVSL